MAYQPLLSPPPLERALSAPSRLSGGSLPGSPTSLSRPIQLWETNISNEQAKENVKAFKDWMLDSSIVYRREDADGLLVKILRRLAGFTGREDVEKAFDIIMKDLELNTIERKNTGGYVEDLVCGPALKHCRRSNFWTWGSFPLILLMSHELVQRDMHGLALFPSGLSLLLIVVVWLVATVVALSEEYAAAMYVLPAQAIAIGDRYTKCCGAPQPFERWVAKMLLISLAYRIDILTTAVFIGRVWNSCGFCNELNNRWAEVINFGSVLYYVPVLHSTTFEDWVLCGVIVMVSQFVYALIYAIPVSPNLTGGLWSPPEGGFNQVNYDICDVTENYDICELRHGELNQFLVDPVEGEDKKQRVARGIAAAEAAGCNLDPMKLLALHRRRRICTFHTLGRQEQGYGRAVQALVESGRMNLLQWNDDEYIKQAVHVWTAEVVTGELRRTLFRFLLFALQGVFITNFQVTFFGIVKSHSQLDQEVNRHLSNPNDNQFINHYSYYFTAASTVFTALFGCKYVFYELTWIQYYLKRAKGKVAEFKEDAANDQRKRWKGRWLQRRYSFSFYATCCLALLFLLTGTYLGFKVVMVMVSCKSGSWNVRWVLHNGCVPHSNITITSCPDNIVRNWSDALHHRIAELQPTSNNLGI